MPGGRMPTSEYGRPASAPGVGKDSKRHDLEKPKTPGLHGSDLQQGDVQMLEQGQQVAPPAGSRTQAPARPQGNAGRQAGPARPMEVPDGLEFAKTRIGNTLAGAPGESYRQANPQAWLPLMRRLASDPEVSGPLTTSLISQIGNIIRQPAGPQVRVFDQNGMDDVLAGSMK